jgi:hypothetical protein
LEKPPKTKDLSCRHASETILTDIYHRRTQKRERRFMICYTKNIDSD